MDYWLTTLILNNHCIVQSDNEFWMYQCSQRVLWRLLNSRQSMTWHEIQWLSECHWLSIQTYPDHNQSRVRPLFHDRLSRTLQWSLIIIPGLPTDNDSEFWITSWIAAIENSLKHIVHRIVVKWKTELITRKHVFLLCINVMIVFPWSRSKCSTQMQH
jgi:hypothetical protein